METNLPSWITGILGILGGGAGTLLINAYFKKREIDSQQRKEESSIKISENVQAIEIYKDVIKILKGDMDKLSDQLDAVEKGYLIAREENARLQAKLEFYEKNRSK